MGQKWMPTPCRDTPICTVQQHLGRFARSTRLRALFGQSACPKYRLPNPGFQPGAALAPVEAFLADLDQSVMACYRYRATLMRMKPIHSNVSPVLAEAITRLKGLRDIIIKPADKNMGMVVLDKPWYQAECERLLGDSRTYSEVPAADIPQLISRLQQELAGLVSMWRHALPTDVYDYLMASTSKKVQVPHLYLLPKVHKMQAVTRENLHQLKGRPIAANHSWVTTEASIFLADVLNQVCYSKFEQVLPNSTTLVKLLESSVVSADAYLVTFDIENMYPSIDNDAAVEACAHAVPTHIRGVVFDLLSFVMKHGYCQNQGKFYQQIFGTVTGTNVAPPYANIYVAQALEAPAKQAAAYWPEIYKRFIDDGFFVWERDMDSLHAFLHQLNSLLPNIKITWHISQDTVAYMDLQITKQVQGDTATFVISTYQKPHNRYLYIPYTSFHRRSVYRGFVKAELLRYAVTNTHAAGFERMKQLFYHRLQARGYPTKALDAWFGLVQHADRVRLLDQPCIVGKPTASVPPVLVLPNGQFEMTISLASVVNSVFARHKHHAAVAQLFGGVDARILVAYYKNQSLGARFIKASH